jgi:hypothetical protein
MGDEARLPDWVRCASCWTVYAPALLPAPGCPKCGSAEWLHAAIPDGEEPLRPPVDGGGFR